MDGLLPHAVTDENTKAMDDAIVEMDVDRLRARPEHGELQIGC